MRTIFPLNQSRGLKAILLLAAIGASSCKKDEEDKNFSVTVTGDGLISTTTVSPVVVKEGETAKVTVASSSATNLLSTEVRGDCPAGTWADGVYTTGPITADCTLGFAVIVNITATAGDKVTATNLGVRSTRSSDRLSWVATAEDGFLVSGQVEGNCPYGRWSGNEYFIYEFRRDCAFEFKSGVYLVTAGGPVAIAPYESAAVNPNEKASFTVTANSKISLDVTGTCPVGTWESNKYTTGAITEACNVVFKTE